MRLGNLLLALVPDSATAVRRIDVSRSRSWQSPVELLQTTCLGMLTPSACHGTCMRVDERYERATEVASRTLDVVNMCTDACVPAELRLGDHLRRALPSKGLVSGSRSHIRHMVYIEQHWE